MRYKETEEVVYFNPDAPEVSDYEGMKVRYVPSESEFFDQPFRRMEDIVKYAEEHGLTEDVRERIYAIYLSQSNFPLGHRLIGAGGRTQVTADMPTLFGPAMALMASAIVVFHNHPSGRLVASPDDQQLTMAIVRAGSILSTRLLDHLIVSREGVISIREEHPNLWERALEQMKKLQKL